MELTCNNDVNCRKFFFFSSASKQVKTFFFNHPHEKFLVEKIKCKKRKKETERGCSATHHQAKLLQLR